METATRVHAICQVCLGLKPNTREPIAIDFPHCCVDKCCFCGHHTHLGIYYRDVEQPTEHCRCDTDTVHPGYATGSVSGFWATRHRKQRTARYYTPKGESIFRMSDLQDGDVDRHLDSKDFDYEDP